MWGRAAWPGLGARGSASTEHVSVEFRNDKSGLCLDLPDYGAEPAGTHVSVYTCAANPGADNQQWYVNDVFDGTGTFLGDLIQNYASLGQCLDVSGWASDYSDTADGLPLTIYPCYNSSWGDGGYDDHLWQRERATD